MTRKYSLWIGVVVVVGFLYLGWLTAPQSTHMREQPRHFRSAADELQWTGLSHGADAGVKKKTLLPNGVIPHLTGFSMALIQPGNRVARHVHETKHEVFHCVAGVGRVVMDVDGEQVDVPLRAGVTTSIPPGVFHELINEHETDDLSLMYFGVATDD